ncbi:hypothetical protein [Sulfobacillus sp. hq2]|uniref:hypothetical protein n=1 Tax=Sulfobacillus TaxID=28033 RepID=UPI000CD25C21|nr:hypothetical protein [Sulfobacillus sp. hq2]MCY0909394.1 hypothetical protein [Sulfobacillus thermotolerans]POB11839.1 hypothetical protein CO251_02570 [Sulfobacillus sp. hq2]
MRQLQSEWARLPKAALTIVTGIVFLLSLGPLALHGTLAVPYPSALDSQGDWMMTSGWYFAHLLGIAIPLLAALPVLVMESDILGTRRVLYITYPITSLRLFLLRSGTCLFFSVSWLLLVEISAKLIGLSLSVARDTLLVMPDVLLITFSMLASVEWTTDLWVGLGVLVVLTILGLGIRHLPFAHPRGDEVVLFAAHNQPWSRPLIANRLGVAIVAVGSAALAVVGFEWHRRRGTYQ